MSVEAGGGLGVDVVCVRDILRDLLEKCGLRCDVLDGHGIVEVGRLVLEFR